MDNSRDDPEVSILDRHTNRLCFLGVHMDAFSTGTAGAKIRGHQLINSPKKPMYTG